LIQFRFGPNKVIYLGLLQFLLDIIKLIFKEYIYFYLIKIKFLFFLIVILLISLLFWLLINFNYWNLSNNYFYIIILILILIKLLYLIFYLLTQKSLYVQLSFIRAIVQFISYDILLILIIIFILILIINFNINIFFLYQKFIRLQFINFYILYFWFLILLIELLRLPFDFYERESELISGFNLELRSLNFIILFIIEYLDIIFFINLTILIFIYSYLINLLNLIIFLIFLWVRIFTIRFRYDLIIKIIWKKIFFYCFLLIYFYLLLTYL